MWLEMAALNFVVESFHKKSYGRLFHSVIVGRWQNLDRTRSDRQNSDRINNKITAKRRQIKSLGHQLRLLATFAGVLGEKVRTRVIFNKILTNYTSEESLVNVVYHENIF